MPPSPKFKKATSSPWIFVAILVLGAISFSVSLAWNDYARLAIKRYTPVDSNDEVKARLYYAITATVILIILAFVIAMYYPTIMENMN